MGSRERAGRELPVEPESAAPYTNTPAMALAAIQDVSERTMVGEMNPLSNTAGAYHFAQLSSGQVRLDSTRHFDGSNYLFVDGHVKWLKPGAPTPPAPPRCPAPSPSDTGCVPDRRRAPST